MVNKIIRDNKKVYFIEPTTFSASLYAYVKNKVNDKGLFVPITLNFKIIFLHFPRRRPTVYKCALEKKLVIGVFN